ncbi:MAG TPA: carboxypeptidase-like regulatory domain-containing protein, partial [Gemmatimonadaceae bacterium]|nr:carboxypeptidase-like regulatory domain-containing protein [Gemmatimonadaceae bacterium]
TPEPAVLSRDGYIVTRGATANYYAPDARVLLSPEFANDHCFGIAVGAGARAGWIGATFNPVRGRRTPDVRGTLWVDTATAELRVLEYQYVNDRALGTIDSLGGRLRFERLPSGDWIVDHWEIRMPTFAHGMWSGYRVVGSDARIASVAAARRGESSIVGTVYDSVHAVPLSGARVALLGRANAATTDSSGAFRLDSVVPGPAVVTAQHALLDTLGLQGIAREIVVDSGAEARVVLATPSYATLWHRACGRGWAPPAAADTGFAYGTVTDAVTGARLSGASVAVAWIDPHWIPTDTSRARAWRVVSKTDSIGTYAVCGLPTDVAARVNAFMDTRTTDRLDLDFAGRRMVRRDLAIGPADSLHGAGPRGVVVGTVRDSAGAPYPDARVLVAGAPEVRTDPDGRFTIRAALPGSRELNARAIGAAPVLMPIEVPSGDTTVANVTLTHVTILSTMQVNALRTSARQFAEYARRRQLGIGYAFDSTAMQGASTLAAAFFSAPATHVRFLHGLDIAVDFNSPRGGLCQATVWIDGRRADFDEFNFYRPSDLAAVEIFPSGAQLPGEFRSFDDLCGAIVVWTKDAFR